MKWWQDHRVELENLLMSLVLEWTCNIPNILESQSIRFCQCNVTIFSLFFLRLPLSYLPHFPSLASKCFSIIRIPKMNIKSVFFILLLIVCSHSENITVSMYGEYKTRNQHKMAVFWRLHSVLSPIGICFNGVILYLFVDERKTLIKSVNVMIWWIFH